LALLAALTLVGCDELLANVLDDNAPAERSARRTRRRRSNTQPSTTPSVGPMQPTNTFQTPGTQPSNIQGITPQLRITFVDVGQGDSALLETADGHAALIDAGPPEGDEHLRAVLAAHAVRRLDWMMLSHPHLDHIGGARNVLAAVSVAQVIDPGFAHPIATYDRLLADIQGRSIPYLAARQGQSYMLGSQVRVEVLEPHLPFLEHSRSDANANSVVVRIVVGSVRVLFTGDAETDTEQRLLSEMSANLQADVLKVAHHGSRYASTAPFLSAVSPRVAVISCATGNDYGHPHAETLAALAGRNVTVYRTDVNGDIELVTDGTRYGFRTTR
jgi:beta-lactamase superfamily II metal-dependent hydrolase